MVLKKYKDLEIFGESDSLGRFVPAVSAQLPLGWYVGEELSPHGINPQKMFSFKCDEAPGLPASALWLAFRGGDVL